MKKLVLKVCRAVINVAAVNFVKDITAVMFTLELVYKKKTSVSG